jgi:hypothetical protein
MVLTSKVRRTSASVPPRMVLPRATPALLIRMVGEPLWAERISLAAAAMSFVEVMSHVWWVTVEGAVVGGNC